MTPKIRNIIIFVAIAAALVLVYIFLIQPYLNSGETAGLVSTPAETVPSGETGTAPANKTPLVAQDFLTLLLSIKNLKLDNTIFSDPAYVSLQDSSITLTPDSVVGRPNPFAQFENDNTVNPPAH